MIIKTKSIFATLALLIFLGVALYTTHYFKQETTENVTTLTKVNYLELNDKDKIPSDTFVIDTTITLDFDSTIVLCDYQFNYQFKDGKSELFHNKVLFEPNIISFPIIPEGECGFKYIINSPKRKEITEPGGSIPKRDDVNVIFRKDDYHIIKQCKTEKNAKGQLLLHCRIITWL